MTHTQLILWRLVGPVLGMFSVALLRLVRRHH